MNILRSLTFVFTIALVGCASNGPLLPLFAQQPQQQVAPAPAVMAQPQVVVRQEAPVVQRSVVTEVIQSQPVARNNPVASPTQPVSYTVPVKYTPCVKAAETGKAPGYTPSFIAKKPRVGPDEEIRVLEAPMCVDMLVVGGWKVVVIEAGKKLVFPKGGNTPVRHPECNNPIRGGVYVGKLPIEEEIRVEAPTPATPTAPPVSGGCEGDCKTTVNKYIDENIHIKRTCYVDGVIGPCDAPLKVNLPVVITSQTTAPCAGCNPVRQAVQAPAAQPQLPQPVPGLSLVKEVKSTVCGIVFQRSVTDNTVLAILQLDEDPARPGRIRIAKMAATEGKALKVSVSSLPHSNDCDRDQAQIYQNLPAIREKFDLPPECVPVRMVRRTT